MRKQAQTEQQGVEQPDDLSMIVPEPIASESPRADGLVNAETANIQQRANAAFRSLLNCSLVTSKYCNTFGDQDLNALEHELAGRTDRLLNGDMRYVEAMLFAQAHALQSVFVNLALKATDEECPPKRQSEYMSLALRAQAGSRATLQALVDVKTPRVQTFVGQQNVAYQQQVNNGPAPNTRTGNDAITSNELLSEANHAAMDRDRTEAPGCVNSELAAVEAINRCEVGERPVEE
jgi:hypothetical protein